jgi:hypothetical protein
VSPNLEPPKHAQQAGPSAWLPLIHLNSASKCAGLHGSLILPGIAQILDIQRKLKDWELTVPWTIEGALQQRQQNPIEAGVEST